MHVPLPRKHNPVEVPRPAGIDAKQKQSTGIRQETGEQGHAHQGMQTLAAKNPGADSYREGTGSQSREHHHVESLPDPPTVCVIHAADGPESGELAIRGEAQGNDHEPQESEEESVDQREAIHRNGSLPAITVGDTLHACCHGAHSCALNPVFFSSSCASCSCPLRRLRMTCTRPA